MNLWEIVLSESDDKKPIHEVILKYNIILITFICDGLSLDRTWLIHIQDEKYTVHAFNCLPGCVHMHTYVTQHCDVIGYSIFIIYTSVRTVARLPPCYSPVSWEADPVRVPVPLQHIFKQQSIHTVPLLFLFLCSSGWYSCHCLSREPPTRQLHWVNM